MPSELKLFEDLRSVLNLILSLIKEAYFALFHGVWLGSLRLKIPKFSKGKEIMYLYNPQIQSNNSDYMSYTVY